MSSIGADKKNPKIIEGNKLWEEKKKNFLEWYLDSNDLYP